MTTIGESVSRVRNTLKAVKEDPFLTDRAIYYCILKYAKTLIKREDNQMRLMRMSSIFSVLPYLELIDVDKVEAGCTGVYSGCYFKRTKDKIPTPLNGMFGPIIRTASSIDGTIELARTEPGTWVSITKSTTYKYNKKVYFWYLNGYIYVPNADWDAIRMELVLEDNVVNCDPANECTLRQEQSFNLPEYLFSEAEQYAIKELTMTLSVPTDGADDGQNAFR
jgi:hypothetical protein